MSAVFNFQGRKEVIEVSRSWLLSEQIDEVTNWLRDEANSESARNSILDIGFDSRLDRVAVQGETIPLEFMRTLSELGVTLWLSIYPPLADHSQPSE